MNLMPLRDLLMSHDSGEWGDDPTGTEDVPVVRVADVKPDYSINWGTAPLRSISQKKRHSKLLRNGDIVVVKASGSAERIISGRAALVKGIENCEYGFANFLLRLTANQSVCLPEYLVYFLNSPIVKLEIKKIVGSTTYPNLKIPDYLNILVPARPISEQRQIVDLLTRAEGIVRLRREAEKKAAELIPALFLDMFGDPATNPKGWAVACLGEIARIIVPTRDKPKSFNGAVPWITIPDVRFPFTATASNLLTHEEANQVGNRLMPAGTVLLSCAGSLGKTSVISVDAYANQQLYGLVPQDRVLSIYMATALKLLGDDFYRAIAGTSTLGFFSKARALGIVLPVPPICLQERFENAIDFAVSITDQQMMAVAKAQETFDALLGRVFSD